MKKLTARDSTIAKESRSIAAAVAKHSPAPMVGGLLVGVLSIFENGSMNITAGQHQGLRVSQIRPVR